MRVTDFHFDLPEDRIAHMPVEPRHAARLLQVKAGGLQDKTVWDLADLLAPGDVLVMNDTKVIPAKLTGKRGEARIDCLLHKSVAVGASLQTWLTFVRPAKRVKEGDIIHFAPDFSAHVLEKREGEVLLEFRHTPDAFWHALELYGAPPLPPYIRKKGESHPDDKTRYQTIYAKHEGAVAAPTAGLHFTEELFARLDAKGIKRVYVTLHVGAGTFLPVKADYVADHKMHSEYFVLSEQAADTINRAKEAGHRIIAVGTTSVRVLETVADAEGKLKAAAGDTSIFITPGYRFKVIDQLFTNFHLPCSTLFMLVCAFAGKETMQRAYQHAIETGYRFYSYGDACLLEKKTA